jgi:hypothetical protein
MEARVKAGIWVSMATRLSDIAGRPAAVIRKGDPDSGGVLCVLRGRQGLLVLSQVRDAEGRPAWLRATGEAPVDDPTADAYIARQVQRDPDLAILQVVRQDDQPINQYSSRHAVHVAVAGQLAAVRLGWGTDTATSLFRAALTMNLSMSELQDKLATQVTPLTALQRQAILEHPERGAELLETAGVTDPDWLAAVRGHHCFEPGGYPQGLGDTGELAKLLHRADVFAAKFSPRSTRAAQAPDAAVRNFFQAAPGDAMTAAIVKEFGLYPPGATVRLKSGEIGVVMRRGERANTPMVAAVTDCNGDVLLRPERRDTAKPTHAVVATLPAKALKVRVNVEAMIRAMPG